MIGKSYHMVIDTTLVCSGFLAFAKKIATVKQHLAMKQLLDVRNWFHLSTLPRSLPKDYICVYFLR